MCVYAHKTSLSGGLSASRFMLLSSADFLWPVQTVLILKLHRILLAAYLFPLSHLAFPAGSLAVAALLAHPHFVLLLNAEGSSLHIVGFHFTLLRKADLLFGK